MHILVERHLAIPVNFETCLGGTMVFDTNKAHENSFLKMQLLDSHRNALVCN